MMTPQPQRRPHSHAKRENAYRRMENFSLGASEQSVLHKAKRDFRLVIGL